MPSYMNTVVTASGTNMPGGVADKFTDSVRAIYSKELQFTALPIMKFLQFATVKTELNVEPGLEIKMLRFNNLKKGGKLVEGVRMQTQSMSTSMASITVSERGNAVAVTELALKSTFYDTMAAATTLLGRDMAIVLDTELRDTTLTGTHVIYARKKDSNGKPIMTKPTSILEMDETCTFDVATIKDGAEILATNNAPKFVVAGGQDFYISFVHPHQSRTLRDDPYWIDASKYGAVQQLFNGEIGRIEDVRFIETTVMCNGAAPEADYGYDEDLADQTISGGKTVNLYKAVMFGPDYYGFAIALPPELRDNGVQDFGREHGLAWYAIWGTGILHDEYGVVIVTL